MENSKMTNSTDKIIETAFKMCFYLFLLGGVFYISLTIREILELEAIDIGIETQTLGTIPVSYTHLTLPTILRV